jgi:hypothetical protein
MPKWGKIQTKNGTKKPKNPVVQQIPGSKDDSLPCLIVSAMDLSNNNPKYPCSYTLN